MIAEFLNRAVVLDQLNQLRELVAAEVKAAPQGPEQVESNALLADLDGAAAREQAQSSGQPGFDPLADDDRRAAQTPPLDDYSFLSRDPIVSLLQSALDELYQQPEHADKVAEAPPADDRRGVEGPILTDRSLVDAPEPAHAGDRRLFDRFSITDIGWVRSKVAEGIRSFRGKRRFEDKPAPPVEMPDRARVVMVGDWGTGLPRARKIAAEMRTRIEEARQAGVAVHVVHLGDVYYSGWGHEYRSRFLPYWPVKPDEAESIGSWCVNGNHDMFSGGHAYYDVALGDRRFKRWQAGSSFFSLVNRHWKVLGLDTAWEDHALKDPQADWLLDELKNSGGRKSLLLSHHQLFSAYERAAREVGDKVNPVLATYPATAWFWGHEHRCMLFNEHLNVRFARCVGHGGVPVYMGHKENDPYPPPGAYEYRKFIQKGLERWAMFGFAVLDFDGPKIEVHYVDEDGTSHRTEHLS